MSLPAQIVLERHKQSDEGRTTFSLELDLLGVAGKNIIASIESEPGFQNPKLISVIDHIGLLDLDRNLLLVAAFEKMARYHGEGPTGGTIQWARWVTPNITEWLRNSLYQQTASRITRTMQTQFAGAVLQAVSEFTESLEA